MQTKIHKENGWKALLKSEKYIVKPSNYLTREIYDKTEALLV